jgi:hypothetical protein
MGKQRLVYGLVILFQTLTLTGIGLAMFHLATAAPEASSSPVSLIGKTGDTGAATSHVSSNGAERFSTDEGLLDEPGLAAPQPDGAAGLLAVDPVVEHPSGHLRQTASQVDDSPFGVCGSGAS